MAELTPELEKLWAKFAKDAVEAYRDRAAFSDLYEGHNDPSYVPQFEGDDRPEEWGLRHSVHGTRLVSLNVPIMAVHIIAARFGLKVIPSLVAAQLQKFARAGAGWLLKKAATKVGGRLVPYVQLIVLVAGFVIDIIAQIHADVEFSKIHYVVRRDLATFFFTKKRDRDRKTKYVYTRHFIPRQRRPNKSWTPLS